MRSLSALALLTVLAAAPAVADCRDATGNLLAARNCGFHKDAKGWTASPGACVASGGRPWYLRSFTRSPIGIALDPADRGKCATYFGRWVTAKGLVGPWSPGTSMTIAA